MKKNILLTICLVVMGILSVNAQNGVGTIALHHEGKVTIYRVPQEAMDASVKGDTLYFSEGSFTGFDVTHGIVVIGAGENTKVTSNITIKGNAENKDLGDYVFKGLNLAKDFVVNDSVKGFRMIQCQMNNFTINNGKFMDEAVVNMSYVKNRLTLQTSIYGLTFAHSKIREIYYGGNFPGAVSFYHCNIYGLSYSNSAEYSTFINSIVQRAESGIFMNCLCQYNNFGAFYDSYKDTKLSFDNAMNCSYSDEELESKGYLGNDGTVVGITGGDSPYTLELFTPHIVEHKLDMDQVNRTLKVTLKMSSEANKNDE